MRPSCLGLPRSYFVAIPSAEQLFKLSAEQHTQDKRGSGPAGWSSRPCVTQQRGCAETAVPRGSDSEAEEWLAVALWLGVIYDQMRAVILSCRIYTLMLMEMMWSF